VLDPVRTRLLSAWEKVSGHGTNNATSPFHWHALRKSLQTSSFVTWTRPTPSDCQSEKPSHRRWPTTTDALINTGERKPDQGMSGSTSVH